MADLPISNNVMFYTLKNFNIEIRFKDFIEKYSGIYNKTHGFNGDTIPVLNRK